MLLAEVQPAARAILRRARRHQRHRRLLEQLARVCRWARQRQRQGAAPHAGKPGRQRRRRPRQRTPSQSSRRRSRPRDRHLSTLGLGPALRARPRRRLRRPPRWPRLQASRLGAGTSSGGTAGRGVQPARRRTTSTVRGTADAAAHRLGKARSGGAEPAGSRADCACKRRNHGPAGRASARQRSGERLPGVCAIIGQP